MPDLDQVKDAQEKDADCRKIIKEIDKYVKTAEPFILVNGVLHRIRILDRVDGEHLVVNLVIPEALLAVVLYWCHSHFLAGHQGMEKTIKLFRRYFYHPRE